jgi:hypothetical protein
MGGSLNEPFDIVAPMTTSPIRSAVCALACALIATLPANLAAQSTPSNPVAQAAPTIDESSRWGLYARLEGQSRKDVDPSGFRLRWRWETPGQVLLEEWFGGAAADTQKPSHVMTISLGSEPGTFILKSSAMLSKVWIGTLQPDGSISFVGKGVLKMRYSIRVDEQGDYVQSDTRGNTYRYAVIAGSAPTLAAADTSSPPEAAPARMSAPIATTAPTAPIPSQPEKPAPVVAKQEPLPPPPPIVVPRKLSEADLAHLRQSVQKSRARSMERARQAELKRQEAARQAQLQAQAWAAAEAQRQADDAAWEAEFEAERARKAEAWQQNARANEQALADSMQRLNDSTARIQAQQADVLARQRAQADALAEADRQRQMELVRQANQRQQEEAARLAAQRQQYEQQRADAQAAERARQQQRGAQDPIAAGGASTDTDANRCVTQSEVRLDDTFKGNTAAYVVNGCGKPVDVKICLMTDSGWQCGAKTGLASQASWSHSAFRATGAVFVDAKTTGSGRRLSSPN